MKNKRVGKLRDIPLGKGICFANPIICAIMIPIFFFIPTNLLAHKSSDLKPVHQHIVIEAWEIWPKGTNNPSAIDEFSAYLDDLGNKDSDPDKDGSAVEGDDIVEGAQEQDRGEPISGHEWPGQDFIHFFDSHFWDPDKGNHGLSENDISAYGLASLYWYGFEGFKGLIDEYKTGDKRRAFYLLGRVAHLLGDMSVPAHVHNDAHLAPDSYEEYVGCKYSLYIATGNESIPSKRNLREIFYELAQITQWVASDGESGNDIAEKEYEIWAGWSPSWQDKSNFYDLAACGWPNEELLHGVASNLMPLAFRYTAALFKLFWEETHGSPATGSVPGDLNGDCMVNQADLDIIGASYGMTCDQEGFDPRADTNVDCVVDIFDLIFVAQRVGASCLPGDMNQDCKVDEADVQYILGSSSYGKMCGQEGFVPRLDLDGNCVVDIYDAIFVSQRIGANCPLAPTGVTATKGMFKDRVVIRWSSVPGATAYRVWRNTSNDSSSASTISSWQSGTSYYDASVTACTAYYYWIKAQNPSWGDSEFSSVDKGYVGGVTPAAPTLDTPSSGQSGVSYAVTWTSSAGATRYLIQESTNSDFSGATSMFVTGTSQSFSHTVSSTTTYYYRVVADNGSCGLASDFSNTGSVVIHPIAPPPPVTPNISPLLLLLLED